MIDIIWRYPALVGPGQNTPHNTLTNWTLSDYELTSQILSTWKGWVQILNSDTPYIVHKGWIVIGGFLEAPRALLTILVKHFKHRVMLNSLSLVSLRKSLGGIYPYCAISPARIRNLTSVCGTTSGECRNENNRAHHWSPNAAAKIAWAKIDLSWIVAYNWANGRCSKKILV